MTIIATLMGETKPSSVVKALQSLDYAHVSMMRRAKPANWHKLTQHIIVISLTKGQLLVNARR